MFLVMESAPGTGLDNAILKLYPKELSVAKYIHLQTVLSDDILEEKVCFKKSTSWREKEHFQRRVVSVSSFRATAASSS